MNRKETLQLLRQHKAELSKRYDVSNLSLFGSIVPRFLMGVMFLYT